METLHLGQGVDYGETQPCQHAEPRQRIADHRDLLAFLERPGTVIHRQLDGLVPLEDEFDEKLIIKIKAIAFEIEAVKTVAAEHLEHRERVLEALPEEDIHQAREKP